MMNVGEVEHWVIIKVCNKMGGDPVEFLSWGGMTFEQRMKWDWYFRYRAALAQVSYPRLYIEFRWGNEVAKGHVKRNNIQNKLLSAKRKLTEWKNKLHVYEAKWVSLFPIDQDPSYQQAICKIKEKEAEVISLKAELNLNASGSDTGKL